MTAQDFRPQDFWQDILPAGTDVLHRPFTDFYPAAFADGRQLRLPIRKLPQGHHAVASLIINQASFTVQEALAEDLARLLTPHAPDVIVGLPTLGLTLAAQVARVLGHSRYVPLGTSRKFWYLDELSVPLSSITTPEQTKRLHVDPRMLPLVQGRRVALIDDVVSSGRSMLAGLQLLAAIGVEPVVLGVAMKQSKRWRAHLASFDDKWPDHLVGVLSTPLLSPLADGSWGAPDPAT